MEEESGFYRKMVDKREQFRVSIRKQNKQQMLKQRREEKLRFMDEAEKNIVVKNKQYWRELMPIVEECISTEPEKSLNLLVNQLEQLKQQDEIAAFLEYYGRRLCEIGLQMLHTEEGCRLVGALASQQLTCPYLLFENTVGRCLDYIRSSNNLRFCRLWTWIIHEFCTREENFSNSRMLQIPQSYEMLLAKSRNSRHYNFIICKLSFDRKYIPEQDMVVRELFATAASTKVSKSVAATSALSNTVKLGLPTLFIKFIQEYVDFSWNLATGSKSKIKFSEGVELMLILADKASPESIEIMLSMGVLDRLADRFNVVKRHDQMLILSLVKAIYHNVGRQWFANLQRDSMIELITKQILPGEDIQLILQGLECLRALMDSMDSAESRMEAAVCLDRCIVLNDIEKLCYHNNLQIRILAQQLKEHYFSNNRDAY